MAFFFAIMLVYRDDLLLSDDPPAPTIDFHESRRLGGDQGIERDDHPTDNETVGDGRYQMDCRSGRQAEFQDSNRAMPDRIHARGNCRPKFRVLDRKFRRDPHDRIPDRPGKFRYRLCRGQR